LNEEGHNPDEYLFEIQTGKGGKAKPVTPIKVNRESEIKEENPAEENQNEKEETNGIRNNIGFDEDELIIKDEIDNECFEDVNEVCL
jgi:hypothetical protein